MRNASGSAPSRPSNSSATSVTLVALLLVVCLGYLYPSPDASAQTEPATGMKGAPMTPAGLQVPSTFRISLGGTVDAQPFGPLPGTLQIVPSAPGDPNPFAVTLLTAALDTQGSLSWSSFTPRHVGPGEVNGTITVAHGQV